LRRAALPAGNIQAVLELLHLGSHGAQILHHQRNAVGLLHAQLTRVADAYAAAGERANRRQRGQLVNQLRRQRAADGG
jgi:hypothetical protein